MKVVDLRARSIGASIDKQLDEIRSEQTHKSSREFGRLSYETTTLPGKIRAISTVIPKLVKDHELQILACSMPSAFQQKGIPTFKPCLKLSTFLGEMGIS